MAPDSPTSQYADQSKIYKDLGNDILKNALSGYNCGLFAYGQTGAGKSFSIFGTPANKGLVPNFCEELFETISQKNIQFDVTLNMIEIYSEQVRDLLNPIANAKGLSVHERPGKGFHSKFFLVVIVVTEYRRFYLILSILITFIVGFRTIVLT